MEWEFNFQAIIVIIYLFIYLFIYLLVCSVKW